MRAWWLEAFFFEFSICLGLFFFFFHFPLSVYETIMAARRPSEKRPELAEKKKKFPKNFNNNNNNKKKNQTTDVDRIGADRKKRERK